MSEPLVRIFRGHLAESIHRGHIAVADVSGTIVAHAGDPAYVTFACSSAKPLQAVAAVESGAAAHYRFTTEETALLCASRGGEELHAAAAGSMLAVAEVLVQLSLLSDGERND